MRFVILPTTDGYDTAFNPAHVVKIDPAGTSSNRYEDGRYAGPGSFTVTPGVFDVTLTAGPGAALNMIKVLFDGTLAELVSRFDAALAYHTKITTFPPSV